VGTNTVIRDDPELTLRHGVSGKQPWRVVVDARGRVSRKAKIFRDAQCRRTLVLTTNLSSTAWRRYLAGKRVTAIVLPHKRGRIDLRAALTALGKRDVTSVLVEGGGELLGSMLDSRLVDRVVFFYAPIVIGGRGAVAAVAGEGVANVGNAVRLRDCLWRRIGKDEMLLEASVAQ
jgi:diaminohydroxyphosphoribosylaminopyrimidine deaminase/5-amino-6-(5-phosphoribosylamino)uracil reductase